MLITISAVLKPVALIKHAPTRGGQLVVLPASWSQAWEALWGSIFRAGRPGCPLTHICFYKYSLSNVGGGRMFTRSEKGGLGSKDKKREKRQGGS